MLPAQDERRDPLRRYVAAAGLNEIEHSALEGMEPIYRVGPNTVYRFRADGRTHILKVPNNDEAGRALEREAGLMRLAEAIAGDIVVTPRDVKRVSMSYLGYPEIAGRIERWSYILSLTERERRAIGEKLGRFLSRWHSLPPEMYEGLSITQGRREGDSLEDLLANALSCVLRERDLIPHSTTAGFLIAAGASLRRFGHDEHPATKVLLHNDINANNLIFEHDSPKVKGLIDFGNACIDDHHADFRFLAYRDWHVTSAAATEAYECEANAISNETLLKHACQAGLSAIRFGPDIEKTSRTEELERFIKFCAIHGIG